MKNFTRLIGISTAILLLSGCSSPTEKKEKLEQKKEVQSLKVETNRLAQIKQGAGMSDAALHIINKNPAPTIYDDVAKMSLETSLLSFQAADVMPPSYELLRYRKMVEDLISTNDVIKASASNQLHQVQAQLANTERREQSLLSDLEKIQAKLDTVNKENAALATTWSSLKRIFWWAVWIVGGFFILRVVAAVVPPPYNSIGFVVDHVLGGLCRMVFATFSHAKEAAKVVSKDAHDLSEETLKQVVEAIQQAKGKDPAVRAVLEPLLLGETEKNSTRLKITAVKRDLGYV
jgi:PBP1b-binding outer membrane lipoprotein LpoB